MEKLCIFCKNFSWSAEKFGGMGSTMTGPMMEGGWAVCAAGHYGSGFKDLEMPQDEADYRRVILRGVDCKDYDRVDV